MRPSSRRSPYYQETYKVEKGQKKKERKKEKVGKKEEDWKLSIRSYESFIISDISLSTLLDHHQNLLKYTHCIDYLHL